MMKTKLLALILAVAMAVALLAGCDASSETTATAGTTSRAATTATTGATAATTTTRATTARATTGTTAPIAAMPTSDKLKFAFIASDGADESVRWMQKTFEDQCRKLDIESVVYDAAGSVEKQTDLASDAVYAGCSAVILMPVDATGSSAACKVVKDAGVFIALAGGDIVESDRFFRDYVSRSDEAEAGRLAAELVRKQFPNGAGGVMVTGPAGQDTVTKRAGGFEQGIQGSSVQLLDKPAGTWDAKGIKTITEGFLSKHGSKVQYVFSHWDRATAAIVEALEAKDRLKGMYIVSVNGSRAGLDLVNKGKIAATIYQDVGKQVVNCVEAARKALQEGKTDKPVELVPWTVVTKANANVDPGW